MRKIFVHCFFFYFFFIFFVSQSFHFLPLSSHPSLFMFATGLTLCDCQLLSLNESYPGNSDPEWFVFALPTFSAE